MFKFIEKTLDMAIGADQVRDFSDRPEVPPWKKKPEPEIKLTEQQKEIIRRLFSK